MANNLTCQGRELREEDLLWLKSWVFEHKNWSRWQLAKELCLKWDWRTATGRIKSFAASSLLKKLDTHGLIELPPIRIIYRSKPWSERGKASREAIQVDTTPISDNLKLIRPLELVLCDGPTEDRWRFERYLVDHHYLGFGNIVGEHLRYLVRDRNGRDLSVLLFGAPAWQLGPRDTFLGWDAITRKQNLSMLTSNTRFLVLPWVRVDHLATHVLGLVLRRLCRDWENRYGHPIYGVETFVDTERFKGTCYRASNWLHLGQTQGRGRQEKSKKKVVAVKDVFFYPLHSEFRERLAGLPEDSREHQEVVIRI